MNRQPERVLDEYLVLSSQRGDAAALDLLVRRWYPRLVRHASRFLGDAGAAEDAIQEAWIAIVRGLHRLDDPGAFSAWAYRVVTNKCRDLHRRDAARHSAADRLEVEPRRVSRGPEDAAVRSEQLRILRSALHRLALHEREVLTLFYLEELSVAEVAEALDVPRGTVKSRLYHAREALRKALGDET